VYVVPKYLNSYLSYTFATKYNLLFFDITVWFVRKLKLLMNFP
jgi:hypothetical protein